MPTPLITEDWRAQACVPGRSATRAFDITGASDFATALAALATQEGVFEGAAYNVLIPGDLLAIDKGGLSVAWNGRIIRVTANYTPGGTATAGGDGTPPAPTDRKWKCRMQMILEGTQKPYDGRKKLIVNSNRDTLGILFPTPDMTIVLTMTRQETGSGLFAKARDFHRRVNTMAVTLPKLGTAAPGELMLASIEVPEDFTSASTYVTVTYTFHARPMITDAMNPDGSPADPMHSFRIPAPDVGLRAYGGDDKPSLAIQFKKSSGQDGPPPGPVPLNGQGAPKDADKYGVFSPTGGTGGGPGIVDATDRPLPPDGDPAPAPYLASDDGVTFLYDATFGDADLNDLNIAANL